VKIDLLSIDTEGPEAWDLGYETASKLWTDRRCVDVAAVILEALPGCCEDDPGFLAVVSEVEDGARSYYNNLALEPDHGQD